MGINRNIVECKSLSQSKLLTAVFVLIETLWNVNIKDRRLYPGLYIVLIETLWNVNTGTTAVK